MITYLKTIKNITETSLIFDNFTLDAGTSFDIDTNLQNSNNFILINKYYFSGFLEVWDSDNIQIVDNISFDEVWSFWRKIYSQKEKYPIYFKLYDYLTYDSLIGKIYDFSSAPKSVDYIKDVNLRFARKETFTRGFLTNVEYYESSTTGADNITYYSNPILNVNMKYYVNSIGYVSYRETTRKWMKTDGTYSPDTKISIKQYNGVMSREEAIQRRNNITNQLIIDIVNIVYMNNYLTKTFDEVELMVLPLMDTLENEFNKYIKGNLQPLIIGISNASNVTYPWLDIIVEGSTTLQDFIENKLLESILAEGMYTSTEPS